MGHHYHNHESHTFGGLMFGLMAGLALGLMFSPNTGQENRKRLRNWMGQMQGDLEERLRHVQDLTQTKYNEIIDELNRKYGKLLGIKNKEYDDFVADLRNRWGRIKDQWNNQDYNEEYPEDNRWR